MKQTKQTQTNNKPTKLGKWNPDNIDGAKLYEKLNNASSVYYKPYRTLNNY